MKTRILLGAISAFILFIGGATYLYFIEKAEQAQVELNPKYICDGITFGEDCHDTWFLNLDDQKVNLTILPDDKNDFFYPIYNRNETYSINDGEKLICTKINDSVNECKPKKLQYIWQVNKARISYEGNTNDCFFINDTAKSTKTKLSYCGITIRRGCNYNDFDRVKPKHRYCDYVDYNLCIVKCVQNGA